MKILGLMSGTSLDGIDLALCDITEHGYKMLAAETVPYYEEWKQRLSTLEHASAYEYALANVELGHHYGRVINRFLKGKEQPEAIASHGHTIFHQPDKNLTTQIGDGDAIAAETGLPVVFNFRTLDVALGGQGAPLVPIGDELLFGQYDACLNLGGIANISYDSRSFVDCSSIVLRSSIEEQSKNNRRTIEEQGKLSGIRVAYDICPCNMALNRLAAMLGYPYDKGGVNARGGQVHTCLLHQLDMLDYYAATGPKSLGKEWFVDQFWPVVKSFIGGVPSQSKVRDALATVSAHIAMQIGRVLEANKIGTLLVTGGGAWNSYLIEQIGEYSPSTEITVPDKLTVDYKEALIFALLGYLRLGGKVNTLASVTGAKCDSVGGNIAGKLKVES